MTSNAPLYMRAYYHRKRDEVLKELGNKCALCGCTDRDSLEIDNKNRYYLKTSPSGSHGGMRNLWDAVKLIRAGRKNELRILCKRCNLHNWGDHAD